MQKYKNLLNGFTVLLVLSVIGLAATSISAINTVKPLSEWLAATIGGKETVTASTFAELTHIPQAHWLVIGLFALSTATSAANYIAAHHREYRQTIRQTHPAERRLNP